MLSSRQTSKFKIQPCCWSRMYFGQMWSNASFYNNLGQDFVAYNPMNHVSLLWDHLCTGVILRALEMPIELTLKAFIFNGLLPLLVVLVFQSAKAWNSKYFKWEKICKDVLRMWFVNLFGIFINTESLLEHFKDYKRIVFMERNYSLHNKVNVLIVL